MKTVSTNESSNRYDRWHREVAAGEEGSQALLRSWHRAALALLPDLDGKAVLEIGCGRGDFSRALAARYPGAKITAVDFSPGAIEIATARGRESGGNVEFMVADGQSLPFQGGTFDRVVSCECLEHVPSPERMAAEISRVLRPGGRYVLTTENYFNGLSIAWLKSKLSGRPFDSGAGVQPVEHYFLFWRVRRMLVRAGLCVERMESHHFQWLLLPRVDPAALCTEDFASPLLRRAFLPFGRHFAFAGSRP